MAWSSDGHLLSPNPPACKNRPPYCALDNVIVSSRTERATLADGEISSETPCAAPERSGAHLARYIIIMLETRLHIHSIPAPTQSHIEGPGGSATFVFSRSLAAKQTSSRRACTSFKKSVTLLCSHLTLQSCREHRTVTSADSRWENETSTNQYRADEVCLNRKNKTRACRALETSPCSPRRFARKPW